MQARTVNRHSQAIRMCDCSLRGCHTQDTHTHTHTHTHSDFCEVKRSLEPQKIGFCWSALPGPNCLRHHQVAATVLLCTTGVQMLFFLLVGFRTVPRPAPLRLCPIWTLALSCGCIGPRHACGLDAFYPANLTPPPPRLEGAATPNADIAT